MNRLFCLTVAFALAGTAAFGQDQLERQGHDVYFRPGAAATTDAVGLVDQITRALDKSRSLHRVDVVNDDALEVEAPIKFDKDASGRVTITFEVTPPTSGASGGRTYTATCKNTQMERCADAVVLRAERLGREIDSFTDADGGFPPN
jgi:hypothetical protein